MKIVDRLTGLKAAIACCLIAAALSIVLAFFGSERSLEIMAEFPCRIVVGGGGFLLLFCAVRGLFRRRWPSSLIHLGCALVAAGWLWGQIDHDLSEKRGIPCDGAMAMIDGDELDYLCTGSTLTEYVGKIPFKVRLEKFIVSYYPDKSIREYRSRVTITEPGKDPYVKNIVVNRPARVMGYDIYQMSWGRAQDNYGRPVVYTVLSFIRDRGLPLVYGGFISIVLGVLLYLLRCFREQPRREVRQ